GAPADPVQAYAGEAGDGWGEWGPVGRELDDAAPDVADDAGLRSRHPVLPTPEVAVRIEHEPPRGVNPAASETETEDEVGRRPGEVRHERRLAPGAVLRLRVGFLEQGPEFFRVGPRPAGDAGHCLQGIPGCLSAGERGRFQEAS